MHVLILFPIFTSTSKVSPTRRLGGNRNSACNGRKTVMETGAEKRNPLLPSVRAHKDHLPASSGADIVMPDAAISEL